MKWTRFGSFAGFFSRGFASIFLLLGVPDAVRTYAQTDTGQVQPPLGDDQFELFFYPYSALRSGEGRLLTRNYTPLGPAQAGRVLPGMRLLKGTSSDRYFGTYWHEVYTTNPEIGALIKMELGSGVPELSWPMGLTYDSKRNRLLLVSLGGEGFLYAYSVAENRWTMLASMENRDFNSIVYHPSHDLIYALADGGDLHVFDAAGSRLREIDLPPIGLHLGPGGYQTEMITVGERIALLVEPDEPLGPYPGQESRIYMIDVPLQMPARMQLSYRKVWQSEEPQNQAPTVRLTLPASGQNFELGATIKLVAVATDQDGEVKLVEFFANGRRLGAGTLNPVTSGTGVYEFEWKAIEAGSFTLIAKAADDEGMVGTSSGVPIVVGRPPEPGPLEFALSFYPTRGLSIESGQVFRKSYTTTAGATDGSRLLPGMHVVRNAGAGTYYGTHWHEVYAISGETGTAQKLPVTGENVEELSWPMGVAFDTKRNRLLLVSLGGEGFLYAFYPAENRWRTVASMDNYDFDSIVYDAATDLIYAYRHGGGLHKFNAEGQPVGMIDLDPPGLHIGPGGYQTEMAIVGRKVALLIEPDQPMGIQGGQESRIYVIDLDTGRTELTYRKIWPAPPPPNQAPSVRIAGPSAGAVLNVGQEATLRAQASDADGEVRSVEFFANGRSLGLGTLIPTTLREKVYQIGWTPREAGSYTLTAKATDDDGANTVSSGVPVTVRGDNPPLLIEARRELPPAYRPGNSFLVKILVWPAQGVSAYAVEDQPPLGWIVSAISHEGAFDVLTRKVKFGPFFDATRKELTYRVTPPQSAMGAHEFSGRVSANGAVFAIQGQSVINQTSTRHPADVRPADNRVMLIELTDYAAAWKTGRSWMVGPNPIPQAYVTRAGAIWKAGEAYVFDGTKPAPECWVPSSASQRMLQAVAAAEVGVLNSVVRAIRVVDSSTGMHSVQLAASPKAGTGAYAVEEEPAAGWSVGAVSHQGVFDAATGVIRWGPFLDDASRQLSYTATRGSGGGEAFYGTASFDGVLQTTAGDEKVGLSLSVSRDLSGLSLRINAQPGQTVVLERSGSLEGPWTEVTEASAGAELRPADAAQGNMFYRLKAIFP